MFAIFCFIFAALPCKAANDKPAVAPPLAVVHTWADLEAQKPVMLQPPARDGKPAPAPIACKLGISETTGEHYGGVALYCLIEQGVGDTDSYGGPKALGPFLLDVEEPGNIQNANDGGESAEILNAIKPGSACLYMKTIALAKAGDYHIAVREVLDAAKQSQFKPVAMATVKVSEKQGTPWSPWSDPDKQPMNTPGETDSDAYSLMIVANPVGGVAIPKWDGSLAVVLAKIPDRKLPLPQITPAEPDPGIQLSVKGNLLTVKLADDDTSIYYPDEHFLTRWWVNGKPVQLKTDATWMKWPRAVAALEVLVKEVRFQVEFHPDRLGVKKGDKVGVQLLFCPQGWECSSGLQAVEAGQLRAIKDGKPQPWRISRMSNRVDFVYSGDPASPALSIVP